MWKLSEIHRKHSWLESTNNTIFISKYIIYFFRLYTYCRELFPNLARLTKVHFIINLSIYFEVGERYYVLIVKLHFFFFSIRVNLIQTNKVSIIKGKPQIGHRAAHSHPHNLSGFLFFFSKLFDYWRNSFKKRSPLAISFPGCWCHQVKSSNRILKVSLSMSFVLIDNSKIS